MNNKLYEKLDNINSMDKPEKVDECGNCTTRGNCHGRGEKCNDYVNEEGEDDKEVDFHGKPKPTSDKFNFYFKHKHKRGRQEDDTVKAEKSGGVKEDDEKQPAQPTSIIARMVNKLMKMDNRVKDRDVAENIINQALELEMNHPDYDEFWENNVLLIVNDMFQDDDAHEHEDSGDLGGDHAHGGVGDYD